MTDIPDLSELEGKLGYHFRDSSLLERAMTHGSSMGKTQEPVKRLAWLGDAMLLAIASQELHDSLADATKEVLHNRREEVRTNKAVACAARAIDLERYIAVGESLKLNVKATTRDKMLATHLEAIIGAAYLDGRFDAVRGIIRTVLWSALEHAKRDPSEP